MKSIWRCVVEKPELFSDCEIEIEGGHCELMDKVKEKVNCPHWQELHFNNPKHIARVVNNCCECPHLSGGNRENYYCSKDMKELEYNPDEGIPTWCKLEDKE